MPSAEYWNRSVLAAAFSDWRSHPRVAAFFAALTGAISFLIGYAVAPPEGAGLRERTLAGLLGLVILGIAVAAVFFLWTVLAVPVRQRNAARRSIQTLQAEISERNRVEFSLSPSVTPSPHSFRDFDRVQALWVEVLNRGPVAEFYARVPPVVLPVVRYEDGFAPQSVQVYNVAWEQTLEWRNSLGVARLKLATVAREPETVFWFWTARNESFNPDGHGIGWRLRPLASTIRFPLTVTDITHQKSVTQMCQVTFRDDGEVEFELIDPDGE